MGERFLGSKGFERRELLPYGGIGSIELIWGCMFAGKSTELISRITALNIALQMRVNNGIISLADASEIIRVFKPDIDVRRGTESVNTKNGGSLPAISISAKNPEAVFDYITPKTVVIAFDEAQFFAPEFVQVTNQLADQDHRVIVAGLNTDFLGRPFGSLGEISVSANETTTLFASCFTCGGPATRTQRIVNGEPAYADDPVVLVGGTESYESRCRRHHEIQYR